MNRNIQLSHSLIAASILVATTLCAPAKFVRAEVVPPESASYLPANVSSAPDIPLPEKQRVPFGWKVAMIATAEHPALVLKWNSMTTAAKPTHLRITVGLDERDEKEVEVTLAESGRRLGLMEVRYPAQFQLYELELSAQDIADVVREGVALRLTKGSELEIFVGGDSLPDEFQPHLVCSGKLEPMEEFSRRMRSLASVQQFGWMEGCVLEGLLDLGELPDGQADREAAEKHLSLFLKDGKLVYESPRSAPSDGRIYGIEATLPFAAIARLNPEHPILQLAVDGWSKRRHPSGSIQDGTMLTSEGTYTVAYPMALIAKARGDEALMLDALQQCRLRTGLFDGNEFWRTKDDDGVRHDRNWARGIAWQLLGLVRTLEVAKDRDDTQDLIQQLQLLSRWVMQYQREDGLWSVIVTEPSLTADTSGCAGIAAALARAARHGWLDSKARDSARRAYDGLLEYLTVDGFLKGASQSNKGGLGIQKSDYRVIFQMGMGLFAQLAATLEEEDLIQQNAGHTQSVSGTTKHADTAAATERNLQWERLELPKGGTASYNPEGDRQVFAIQFDPQGRIYIANRYNGHGNGVVLRSADGGKTWEGVGAVNDWTLKQGPNDGGFRVHPLAPERWFLGSENRGVYATFDDGETWKHVIEAWTDKGIGHGFTFAFHPTDAAIVYASGGVGVFRSNDGGHTWINLGLPTSQSHWVAVDPAQPNRIYATQMWKIGDVLRSDDAGDSWQSITDGIPEGRITPTGYFNRSAWQLHIDAANHRQVFVTTAAGLFISENFGETWQALAPPPERGVMSGRVIFRQSPHQPHVIVTSESLGRIMLSVDTGKTWVEITGNLPTGAMPHRAFGIRVCELQFDPSNPNILYVARSDGLYRTTLSY